MITASVNQGPLPPFVYLGRQWHHSYDKMDQAFTPSIFAYYKRS